MDSPDVARAQLEPCKGQVPESRIGRRAASATGTRQVRMRRAVRIGGSVATTAHHDLSRSAVQVKPLLPRTVVASGRLHRRAETTARLAAIAAWRDPSRSAAQARHLPRRIAAASVPSILRREVKRRMAERAVAVVGTGIALLPARAVSAAIQMGTGEDHHGRSWICVSRSCAVLPTAEAGTREVDTHRAMADLAAHRAILAQVTAAVARGQHLAMAVVGMRLAAEVAVGMRLAVEAVGMHQAVEAVAIPAVAVTPEVEDTPATTKSVCCKLK